MGLGLDSRARSFFGSRLRVAALVAAIAAAVLGYSVAGALTAPGTDSVSARLAEWARSHGGTPIVNLAERLTYRPPKVGGLPPAGAFATGAPPVDVRGPLPARMTPLPAPAAVPPLPLTAAGTTSQIPSAALADEGTWHVLASVGGVPVLRAAFLRADAVHSSYTSALAWMDTHLLSFELHPGTSEPGGGPWPLAANLPVSQRQGVVAAFNSAFRVSDARGGFYEGGRTVGTLRTGAASLVIDDHGGVTVGQWGRDVTMSPSIGAVRQNLDLIVDFGQVSPKINDNSGNRWGSTAGNQLYVWRSGVGITSTEALVYAAGPRLSAETLADLLVRGGAVRAMELDINASWTTFIHYGTTQNVAAGTKLLDTMNRPATLYDTTSSRDFIVARAR